MDFETIWYEYTPYLYAVAAVVAVFHIGSVIGFCAGIMLGVASVVTLKMRRDHRKSKHDNRKA